MFKTILLLAIAALIFTQHLAASGAQRVSHESFVANFLPGKANLAPVLVLEGSGSGLPDVLARKISAMGHPVLALAYYKEPGLPKNIESIPLEYFEPAKTWLLEKTGKQSLAVVGWSKGAELALILASMDDRISKTIAISPSSVTWPGIVQNRTQSPKSSWTLGGKELDTVPYQANSAVNNLRDLYTQSLANKDARAAARIEVEDIAGDILLLSGGKDTIWPAQIMAQEICTTRSRHQQQCDHKHFPNAGHLLDGEIQIGGEDKANQQADKTSRQYMQNFLQ